MDQFYFYLAPSTFDPTAANGYGTGAVVNHPSTGARLTVGPGQEFADLYEALDPLPGEPEPSGKGYHVIADVVLGFSGVVQQPSGKITRTNDWQQVSLDDLYRIKTQELDEYTETVANSAFQHDVGGLEFWAEGQPRIRNVRSSYNNYLTTRGNDQLYAAVAAGVAAGGGTNTEVAAFWAELRKSVLGGNGTADLYWTRDIKVVLYDRATLKQVRDNANQNQWSGLQASQGTFDWQWREANDRVLADYVTAYNDADWLQLAQIDPANPTYNWPPFYAGPWAIGETSVRQMLENR